MTVLGVSLYPEQESMEQIEAYLALASRYGFTKVFTSVFSVPGERDEVVAHFKKLTAIAHAHGMTVAGDVNSELFKKLGATESDLSVFKEMGLDALRMDLCFRDERDVALINNAEGIRIEMSTAFIEPISVAVANGARVSNLTACHNFYPERYSAPSPEAIGAQSDAVRALGVPVALFITSREEGTHGPWPVSDGLPTVEDFRELPVAEQVKFCLAMGNVDEILFGNAFASEEEFRAIKAVMDRARVHAELPQGLEFLADIIPHGDLERVPFSMEVDPRATELEREIVFDYPAHQDLDCRYYMLRSRWTRMRYGRCSIPPRACAKERFEPGDVLVVNDNLKHYRGEVMVCLKPMDNDGQRNYVGRISDFDRGLLPRLKDTAVFTFMEAGA